MPIIASFPFAFPFPISIAINKSQVMPTVMFFSTFNLEYVSHDLGIILFTYKINQGMLQFVVINDEQSTGREFLNDYGN